MAAGGSPTLQRVGPSWSPDGRYDCRVGYDAASGSGELIEVDAATGIERAVRRDRQRAGVRAHEIAYLPGDRLVASQMSVDGTQQWWLYPRTGSAVQLTPDLNDVRGVQLTADRTAGVATRTTVRMAITVGTVAGGTFVEAVAPSTAQPSFAQLDARGHLFYTARVPGGIATFRSDGAGGAGTLVATADRVVRCRRPTARSSSAAD